MKLKLNNIYNIDCMEGMAAYPDKFFDIAIVDPPYGGAYHYGSMKYQKEYVKQITGWDAAPGQEYFEELFRVSKNQIIWGGNYFSLPPTRCFLVWRKLTISAQFNMAMCEYAWTSYDANAQYIEIAPQGGKDKRFHPTQKPVKLYSWVLGLFGEPGDKMLDTHAGSASSLVACQNAGYDYMGFEIDKAYYDLAKKRLDTEKMQTSLFEKESVE